MRCFNLALFCGNNSGELLCWGPEPERWDDEIAVVFRVLEAIALASRGRCVRSPRFHISQIVRENYLISCKQWQQPLAPWYPGSSFSYLHCYLFPSKGPYTSVPDRELCMNHSRSRSSPCDTLMRSHSRSMTTASSQWSHWAVQANHRCGADPMQIVSFPTYDLNIVTATVAVEWIFVTFTLASWLFIAPHVTGICGKNIKSNTDYTISLQRVSHGLNNGANANGESSSGKGSILSYKLVNSTHWGMSWSILQVPEMLKS